MDWSFVWNKIILMDSHTLLCFHLVQGGEMFWGHIFCSVRDIRAVGKISVWTRVLMMGRTEEGVTGQTVCENRWPPGTETCRRHCSKKVEEVEPADERDAPRFLSETHRCTQPHRSQSHLRTLGHATDWVIYLFIFCFILCVSFVLSVKIVEQRVWPLKSNEFSKRNFFCIFCFL